MYELLDSGLSLDRFRGLTRGRSMAIDVVGGAHIADRPEMAIADAKAINSELGNDCGRLH